MNTIPAASLILNAATPILSVFAWLQLALRASRNDGTVRLASKGVESLKYFTVQSNLFSSITCIAYLVCALIVGSTPTWIFVLKLVSATSVMVTFSTVIAILRPKYGWKSMYASGNLWLHLILPLFAAIDCWMFVPVFSLPLWMTVLGAVPTILYGAGYLAVVARNGQEKDGKVYDFYGFFRWGTNKVPVVCVAMIVGSWGLALLLHLGSWACHLR